MSPLQSLSTSDNIYLKLKSGSTDNFIFQPYEVMLSTFLGHN